ncbi:PH domain-containing protein [Micromonospora sp. NPDC005367]|uniref:PH domain-containing protein n=1 Tax=Micromonospora sp. NPDC005367 TaxID=3155590 RepID=UPI0033AC5F9A
MTVGSQWRRLDSRIVWIDGLYAVLSLAPAGLTLLVIDEPGAAVLLPVLVAAVVGVLDAARDNLRWLKTRYRLTDERVEIRTGLLVRKERSLPIDRIRSVSTTARLRHRLAGIRVVTVGTGQPGAAGSEALHLDAVSRATAEELRRRLLTDATGAIGSGSEPAPGVHEASGAAITSGAEDHPAGDRTLARIRWSWLLHNVFGFWSLVTAAGLLWGGFALAGSFGLDAAGFVGELLDWRALGPWWSAVIVGLLLGTLGVLGMAVAFIAENWDFRLARVRTVNGSLLRTTQGLLNTREVNRDEHRVRGIEISEPLLWRWMGTADTNVVSTGLRIWSMHPATTILPRGPVRAARAVAGEVLELDEAENPFRVPLRPHPPAALRRRIGWAVLGTAGVVALIWLGGMVSALPDRIWLAGLGLLPLAVGAAVIAYRSLGHGIVGDYLVVRSGLLSRSTTAVARPAVIGWRVRQSVLQRRLGLATLAATTAAGHGWYAAIDVPASTAIAFAEAAAPGLLTPILEEPCERVA